MAFGELFPRNSAHHLGILTMTGRADYLDRGFTPHLLDISKQGLRAKHMRPVFPVGSTLFSYYGMLTSCSDCDISVSLLSFVVFPPL